jgi:hypothetical protein
MGAASAAMTVGRLGRLAVAIAIAFGGLALPSPAVRAAGIGFDDPTASASYGIGLAFTVDLALEVPVDRVELLLTFGNADAPLVVPVEGPLEPGTYPLRSTFGVAEEGHILPNTRVTSRWRAIAGDAAGSATTSEVAAVVYADDRFDWRTASGDVVRVHWYEGSVAFGERALRIGEEAIAEAEALLGVEEDEPVDFFIYADQEAFYDALGPGTRENVGGQANADIRTLFALIRPDEIDDDWVSIVIPHELDHLVFDTAVANPYHYPPRWLNEGLAVYQTQGYEPTDRVRVEAAARDGSLIPLVGLGGQFPTTRERFFLAYAESVAAVDYLVRVHGQDALVDLVTSYSAGRTDDEAFGDAIGMDLAAFDAAWFASIGATIPDRTGPQPAPGGPLPEGWTGDPAASPGPATSPPPGSGEGPDGAGPGVGAVAVVPLVVVAATLLAVGAWIVASRRRARAATPPPLGSSDGTDG